MNSRNCTCYKLRWGLFLGALLWVLGSVHVGNAQNSVSDSKTLKLTSAATAVAQSGQSQQVTRAYRAGLQAGRADAERDLPRNPRSNRWTSRQDSRDYRAGYNRGYTEALDAQSDDQASDDDGRVLSRTDENVSITIGRDNVVRWQAPDKVRVYVQVDNGAMQLFAEGGSGVQEAPWINSGHLYVFIVRDLNGNEMARDRLDLRRNRR